MTAPDKPRRNTNTSRATEVRMQRWRESKQQEAAAMLRAAGWPVFDKGVIAVPLDVVREWLDSAMPETGGKNVVLDELEAYIKQAREDAA